MDGGGWLGVVGKSDFNENPVVSLDLDFDFGLRLRVCQNPESELDLDLGFVNIDRCLACFHQS